jgi:beta-lactam-binding protein with PASTA domain
VVCVVPRVVGKTTGKARDAITSSHCKVGQVKLAYSKTRKGIVIGQTPKPGTQLKKLGKIDLRVSRGPKPKPHHRRHP